MLPFLEVNPFLFLLLLDLDFLQKLCTIGDAIVCELGISFNMDSSWMSWTLDTEIFSAILVESYFSQTLDWFHWNFISSSFCAYVNFQIPCCMRLLHQFEAEVVLDSDMDLKSNSRILNWIGSPP
jgi:hypothetical protein